MARPQYYLLDTNIVLHLIRASPVALEVQARYGLNTILVEGLISIVTVGEVMSFARQRGWQADRIARVRERLASLHTIPIENDDILEAYAAIDTASHATGRDVGKNDLWIAATARALNIPLLTTDKDFDHLHPSWIAREWVDPTPPPTV